ncbi:MAG: helix-turn-helix domain-containing protein [Allosphingosinicella sp.]
MISSTSANNTLRSAYAIHVTFRKDAVIFNEGDVARYWFEVESGIVRTCRFDSHGNRQLTGFYYAGETFGVYDGIYEEAAEAVTDVHLIAYRRSTGVPPTGGGPESPGSEAPLRSALESARRCIFLLGRKTATARVAAFLLAQWERADEGSGVVLAMSRCDIGDHLGLTLHTVSRTISDFARRRLIALDGPQRIRILDPAGLRRLAGEDGMPDSPRPLALRSRSDALLGQA